MSLVPTPAPTTQRPPLRLVPPPAERLDAVRSARVDHPANTTPVALAPVPDAPAEPRSSTPGAPRASRGHDGQADGRPSLTDEDGSLVSEYGFIAILGATVVGLCMEWASGGAIWDLFGAILDQALALVM